MNEKIHNSFHTGIIPMFYFKSDKNTFLKISPLGQSHCRINLVLLQVLADHSFNEKNLIAQSEFI